MTESLALEFTLDLGRAGREGLAAFADVTGSDREAVVDGNVAATIRTVCIVLAEMLEVSVFSVLAEPKLDYEIDDPSDEPGFSEAATAAVRLSIPTSPAHREALRGWARRPPSDSPRLFEHELRTAFLTL